MAGLTISEIAEQVGFRASTIRYYESIGLLPPAHRIAGQRRYDETALYRLAIIQRARQLGFTLEEIRRLFFGFRGVTRASERWHALSREKIEELDALADSIKSVRQLLQKVMSNCNCDTLEQCGKRMFRSSLGARAKTPTG